MRGSALAHERVTGPASRTGGRAPHIESVTLIGARHVSFPQTHKLAEPVRSPARPPDADPDRRAAFRQRPPAEGPLSGGDGDGDLRPRLLLGRRAQVLAARRGVWVTAVGYAGGVTPNPTYEEVCSGRTGHNEVVLVVFDPKVVPYEELLKTFWESHDPTQGMRQGNDVGTQYRSGIYVFDEAQRAAGGGVEGGLSAGARRARLRRRSRPRSLDAGPFYFAEDYHQQYLAKNPARLLRARRHRRRLPDRHRRRGLTFSATLDRRMPPCAVRRRDLRDAGTAARTVPLLEPLAARALLRGACLHARSSCSSRRCRSSRISC